MKVEHFRHIFRQDFIFSICFALVGFILFVGSWLGVSHVIVRGHGIILVLVV